MSNDLFAYDDPIARATDALLDAAALGRVPALQQAINDGGNPNYVRMYISPALIATSRDYLECLKLIIEAGGGADIPNSTGWTALHEAATKEDTSFLEVILASEYEQHFTVRDRDGVTALRAAVDAGRPEAVVMLLAEAPDLLDMADMEGVSPIMAAAQARNSLIMETLLEAGADLSGVDSNGRNLANYVEDWPEGRALIEGRDLSPAAASIRPSTAVAVEQVKEEEPETSPVVSNPFGLGAMSKKRKGP